MLTIAGNTTIDVFVHGVDELPGAAKGNRDTPHLVFTGERVMPNLGGCGAGAAFVAATLGEQVRLWSAVGHDPFGEMALGWLHGVDINTASVRITTELGTSTSVVVVDKELRRQTYHYLGASSTFVPRTRGIGGIAGDWFLVTGYTFLPAWRGEVTYEFLRTTRRNGLATALDFGPVAGEPVTREELAHMLPHVTLLLCNRTEMEQATGMAVADGAAWALDKGAEAVVVKMGPEGAMAFDRSAPEGAGVSGFEPKGAALGAGDSFNAGLIFALSRKMPLMESVRFANATAALVLESPRGILDAPREEAVRAFLEKRA
jgi:sugar/nucleoside kinase (ribokinase family)